MHFRVFAQTLDFKEAEDVFYDVISSLKPNIKNISVENVEQYWKFDDLVVVSAKVELVKELDDELLDTYLKTIANTWCRTGDEGEDITISNTIDDVEIYKDKVEFVDIWLDEIGSRLENADQE